MSDFNWEMVFNHPDAVNVYFNGNGEAWLDWVLHNHELDWVDDFVKSVGKTFYSDEPNAEKDLRWIIGMMNYQTKEFDVKEGDVTCEFVTKEIYKPVIDLLKRYFKPDLGIWKYYSDRNNGAWELFITIENI